jgi:hypothetical protein
LNGSTTPPAADAPKLAIWWHPPVFFAILALIVGALYLAGHRVYLTHRIEHDRGALERAAKARVLLAGSSHGHDFSLKRSGLDGVDFSRGGQDLFEVGYIIRSAMRRARHVETVLIAMSYFSFSFDNAAYVDHGVQTRIGRRIQTYAGFGRLAFLPGDAPQFLKGSLWPLVTNDHYQRMFHGMEGALAKDEAEEDEGDVAQEPQEKAEPRSAERVRRHPARERRGNFQRHAMHRCQSYLSWMRVMAKNHPRLASDAKTYLLDLVRELEAEGVRVVLFTPPFLEYYTGCFDARYQRQMRDGAGWVARQTHARYFDFSLDPAFTKNEDYFSDSDHLNDDGRAEFTQRLLVAIATPDKRDKPDRR